MRKPIIKQRSDLEIVAGTVVSLVIFLTLVLTSYR